MSKFKRHSSNATGGIHADSVVRLRASRPRFERREERFRRGGARRRETRRREWNVALYAVPSPKRNGLGAPRDCGYCGLVVYGGYFFFFFFFPRAFHPAWQSVLPDENDVRCRRGEESRKKKEERRQKIYYRPYTRNRTRKRKEGKAKKKGRVRRKRRKNLDSQSRGILRMRSYQTNLTQH